MTTTAAPEALAAWLADQRWFAGKDRDARLVGAVEVPLTVGPGVALVVAEVATADDDDHERYQLLVAIDDLPAADSVAADPDAAVPEIASGRPHAPAGPPTAARDALAEPATAAAFLDLFRAEAEAGGPEATASFHWLANHDPVPAGPVRPIGAEQSNSSVVIAEALVLKVFRRLQAGVNPELEMGSFLTGAGYPDVAALAGWYELRLGGAVYTLGVVQDLVADGRDGWEFVLDGLAADPGGLLAPLHQLGAVVAGLHNVLGSATDDPAFASRPCDAADVAAMARGVAADATRVLGAMPAGVGGALGGRAGEIDELADSLAAHAAGGRLIRHHGDLHLGQTLRTPAGWVLLDFEGEPARSLDQRRARHTPLRDVAGMLRSFAYAVATYQRAASTAPLPAGWEAAARAALLDGYLAAVDPELIPAPASDVAHLLALLELEKVVYELGYELGHRPDWVAIPAAGLTRLLDGAVR